MATTQLHDPDLVQLAHRLDLKAPANPEEWHSQARLRLGNQGYEEFEEHRAILRQNPSSEAEFYDFLGANPLAARAVLEGRLGYYDAVLPELAAALQTHTQARVVDLGAYYGIVALCLAKKFPALKVIGIERCAGAVHEARNFQRHLGIDNVEFLRGDYASFDLPERFEVVLSLQSMPTYWLPWLPSESPESFARGKNLQAESWHATSPVQRVAVRLAGVRRFAATGGRVILHERMHSASRAGLFLFLAARAGLRVTAIKPLSWQTAGERAGVQMSPFVELEAQQEKAPFDEARVLDLYFPVPAATTLPAERNQALLRRGAEAQQMFCALLGKQHDVCIGFSTREPNRFHIHLGTCEPGFAYVYTCGTNDYRELKLCSSTFARQLVSPVIEYLNRSLQSGEILMTAMDRRALDTVLTTAATI